METKVCRRTLLIECLRKGLEVVELKRCDSADRRIANERGQDKKKARRGRDKARPMDSVLQSMRAIAWTRLNVERQQWASG